MFDAFKDFPNLHPMFVHFPIVLLLLAAAAQFFTLCFKDNKQLKWLSFILILLATISAFVACKTGVHISGDADEKAMPIFELHKKLANITYYISLIACILRFITLKYYTKKWCEYVLFLVFLSATILVGITAHKGASIVYLYDIGPKGNGVLSK